MKQLQLDFLTDAQIRRTLVECFAQQHSEKTNADLSQHIREFTRQQYRVLGFSVDLRKRDMTKEQRRALRQHEITTIRLLMSMQQQY